MTQPADVVSRFRLKPTRAAKVSEISEATAASAVAPEERVNFHIGNPVQDPRLSVGISPRCTASGHPCGGTHHRKAG